MKANGGKAKRYKETGLTRDMRENHRSRFLGEMSTFPGHSNRVDFKHGYTKPKPYIANIFITFMSVAKRISVRGSSETRETNKKKKEQNKIVLLFFFVWSFSLKGFSRDRLG